MRLTFHPSIDATFTEEFKTLCKRHGLKVVREPHARNDFMLVPDGEITPKKPIVRNKKR